MSETDIYKKREPIQMGKKPEKKQRRRRSSSQRTFDDKSGRKRRSKNNGFRRILHLSRKSENEKMIWGAMGIVFVVVLVIIAVWQYVITEHLIRTEEKASDYIEYQRKIPENSDSEVGKEPLIQ